jgi:hypothetical protein
MTEHFHKREWKCNGPSQVCHRIAGWFRASHLQIAFPEGPLFTMLSIDDRKTFLTITRSRMTSERGTATNESTRPAAQVPKDRNNDRPAKKPKSRKAIVQPQVPGLAKGDWCLIVVPDGDYPRLELFPDLAALKARLRKLDQQGRSVNAFPIFGRPMAFTPGPFRFLYLPDGQVEPIFDFSPFGRFISDPDARPPIDACFRLGPEKLDDGAPQSVIYVHKDRVATPTPANEPRPQKDVAVRPSEEAAPVETCPVGEAGDRAPTLSGCNLRDAGQDSSDGMTENDPPVEVACA